MSYAGGGRAAQALLGSEMQGKTLPEILQAIRQTLTEHFVYDESVSTQNRTQDFSICSVRHRARLQRALCDGRRADAALLRRPGALCRGYYLSGQDAASGEQTFELDETHAHAWAEYYLTGVGWVPFEVTPGYVEAEDLGAGGEAGGKQYENTQLPPVVEQPEQQAPQEKRSAASAGGSPRSRLPRPSSRSSCASSGADAACTAGSRPWRRTSRARP